MAGLRVATLPVGTDAIIADYGGSSNDLASASAPLNQIVTSTTTTTLTSSLNPATHGATITLTAKVVAAFGSTPTGTVTFKYGSAVIGTGTLSAGQAGLRISTLPVGTDSITAVYAGTPSDLTSTSAALNQVIH